MRRVVPAVVTVVVATAAALLPAVPPALAQAQPPAPPPSAVPYQPPLDAAVTDHFRPPATPYGPGNRGVDYATTPGTTVGAAAAGQVVFAGRVGTGLHAVILHADGIRTSYSFLASLAVRRGERVEAGEAVGTAATSLHFGARAGEAYVDPLLLLSGGGRVMVRLVPETAAVMGTVAAERSALGRFLGAVSGAAAQVGGAAVSWARGTAATAVAVVPTVDEVRAWAAVIGPVVVPAWLRLAFLARDVWASFGPCTPASVRPPPPAARRRLVLVAGLASTSGSAGIDRIDVGALGYAPSDVARFSYRGGTTAERSYDAADTQVDIRRSGRLLRDLLERMAAEDPGVPIDVVAHSQGGLVARAALGARAPPGVASLVTLATPHQGADLATALALTARTPRGAVVQGALARLGVSSIDPTSTSVGQLSETSDLVRDLAAQPLPPGVRVTSIAARADLVVASPRAALAGAANVVVGVPGMSDHGDLPGSAAAHREVALALAGMSPTCQGVGDAVADVAVGNAISMAQDVAGLAAFAAAR